MAEGARPPSVGPSSPAPAGAALARGEPVWLAWAVLVLFLVGFSLWLAREVKTVLRP